MKDTWYVWKSRMTRVTDQGGAVGPPSTSSCCRSHTTAVGCSESKAFAQETFGGLIDADPPPALIFNLATNRTVGKDYTLRFCST